MTERELREYVPFYSIADNCVLSKRGDMTFGWRVWLPTAYTVNEAGYNSIQKSFLQAYKLLPAYCVVHKQDIYKLDSYVPEKKEEVLARWYEEHFDGRRYLNGYSYIFLTFSSKSVIEGGNKTSSFFRGVFTPKVVSARQIMENASIASLFESSLNNNPLVNLRQLTTDEFLNLSPEGYDRGIIPEYMSLYTDCPRLEYDMHFENSRYKYGDVVQKAWYIEDSDAMPQNVYSVRDVQSMSSNEVRVCLSGGAAIGYELRIPHIVNRYVLTLPVKVVEKELEQKKKLNNSFSLYSAGCRVNAAEQEAYLLENEKNGLTTIKCFTDLLAWGRENEMEDIRNKVVNAFNEMDVTVCEETEHCPLLHYAGIPGAAAELSYNYWMNSEMNAFLCHGLWDGYDYGIKGGALKLNDRNRMIPITLDIQEKAIEKGLIGNQNALIVGPSGSGKSYFTNKLTNCLYNNGEHILIIDIGDSYQGLCRVINEETGGRDGIYNTYDPANPFRFNPFKGRALWDTVDADGDRVSSGYDFVVSILKTVYTPEGTGWNESKSNVLDLMLKLFFKYWDEGYPVSVSTDLKLAYVNRKRERAAKDNKPFDEKKGWYGFKDPLPKIFREDRQGTDPLFDDFFQFVVMVMKPLIIDQNLTIGQLDIKEDMFDIDNFCIALEKWSASGTYGYLLNATEEADIFSSRLTVFEVDKIKDNKDLFPIWMLCILHSFEDKMRTLKCQKAMIIEEAWQAISKESMQPFIIWLWRTARKFSTSAIVVTQSIDDLVASDTIKDTIVLNSDVKILLDQSKNVHNFEKAAPIIGLPPKDVGLVLSVGRNLHPGIIYKEVFIAIGSSYSNVFGVECSDKEAVVYESKKEKKAPVLALADELGSYIEAVEVTVERMSEEKRKKKLI